jgi:hypothetical protein
MSAPSDLPAHAITLDDIRHKALAIREDVRDEVREQVAERRNQALVVGAVVVLAVIGIAYFAGSRACRRDVEPFHS